MRWDLKGTIQQNAIINEALNLCDFPFDRLSKAVIPVEWADLSRYHSSGDSAAAGGHTHVHEGDDLAHPVERVINGRARVLGLAWYSGKVTIEKTLVSQPRLAQEVFLAEGAHMVDFFYMADKHRRSIVNALHRDQITPDHSVEDGVALNLDGHTCGWFDVGPYEMWVGEAFMEAFIESFSPMKATLELRHTVSPPVALHIRRILLGPELVGTRHGAAYHKPTCPFIRPSWVTTSWKWMTPIDAQRAGRRPCRVCRPS